jgi:hypothetical protein
MTRAELEPQDETVQNEPLRTITTKTELGMGWRSQCCGSGES